MAGGRARIVGMVIVVLGCGERGAGLPSDAGVEGDAGADGGDRIASCTSVRGAEAQALCQACITADRAIDPDCEAELLAPTQAVVCGGRALSASMLWIAEAGRDCVLEAPQPPPAPCEELPTEALGDRWTDQPSEPAGLFGVHREREYKFAVEGPAASRLEPGEAIAALFAAAEVAAADAARWRAPGAIGSVEVDGSPVEVAGYELVWTAGSSGELECCSVNPMVDILLDDAARSNLATGAEYRVRHRFASMRAARNFHAALAAGSVPSEDDDPVRMDIQTKTDREPMDGGFSTVRESRLSFLAEFPPFEDVDGGCWGDAGTCWAVLPAQPWSPVDAVRKAATGLFTLTSVGSEQAEVVAQPAVDLLDWHEQVGTDLPDGLQLAPVVVLFTERHRFHPTLLFDLGFGFPEPSNAFIISLDVVQVFSGPAWVAYLEGQLAHPPVLATFRELEIELERDVTQDLDLAIAAGGPEVDRLVAIEDAFLDDLLTWSEIMRAGLEQELAEGEGGRVVPDGRIKYAKAVEMGSFLRGDVNADGSLSPSDVSALLSWQYLGREVASTLAADVDANAAQTAADVEMLFRHVYLGGPPPPPPWPVADVPCR